MSESQLGYSRSEMTPLQYHIREPFFIIVAEYAVNMPPLPALLSHFAIRLNFLT
jgi:hypothetical protein